MRILPVCYGILMCLALSAPAIGQDSNSDPREIEDIPQDRQDTGLTRETDVKEAGQKAALLAVISSPFCHQPAPRYSTLPLSKAIGIDGSGQEAEIWYLQCPNVMPVLVHYTRDRDGIIGNIHVHEFSVFMEDLPLRPLAHQRNPDASYKDFPKRTATDEAVCFGILSDRLQKTVNRNVPRNSAPSKNRYFRQMCLRMQACNTIEPELDVLQDISRSDNPSQKDDSETEKFVNWCNAKEPRILIAEEPELAYGLMYLLRHVAELTDQDRQAYSKQKHRQ